MANTDNKAPAANGKTRGSIYDNRAFQTVRSVASYLGCIVITLGVTYYLDGTSGIILTAALICALIISLILTLAVLNTINVDISADKTIVVKGETLGCKVKLRNKLILPAPVIEIEADCSPHLSLETAAVYKGALAGRNANVIKIPMKALHSGLAYMKIRRVTLTDYLGIFSFRLKVPEEQLSFKVAVYPNIPDVGAQTDFLKTTNKFSSSDDEEEESDEISITSTGLPGYEHRQYYPGDPIKRINWKLSSKRDLYMVRLDEQIRGAGQMFFLDCPITDIDEQILTVRDNVIEGMLAMFMMLVREGREAKFFFCRDGLWLLHEIHAQTDVYALQELLSDFEASQPPSLIPPEIIAAGKTPICFSTAVKENYTSVSQIISLSPESLVITAASSGIPLMSPDMWTVTDEFEFVKQSA